MTVKQVPDQVWHEAVCHRAAAQLVLGALVGLRVGEVVVPSPGARAAGPGGARLANDPPQSVALALAAGQHAAHRVLAAHLTEADAEAVVTTWATASEDPVLSRLAGAWHWGRARQDAAAVLAETDVAELVSRTAATLTTRRLRPGTGEWQPDLPQIAHRVWDPERLHLADLARTETDEGPRWRAVPQSAAAGPAAVIRRDLQRWRASWWMAGANDDDATGRTEALAAIDHDLRLLTVVEEAAAGTVPPHMAPGDWVELQTLDADGYAVPVAGELLSAEDLDVGSFQARALTVLPSGASVPALVWADRVIDLVR